jgi:hypothetical protein
MNESNGVGFGEKLARYATASAHLRQDNTPRPELFMPHPYPDLSVTRHDGLTEAQIWEIGKEVTAQIGPDKKLRGRADVVCADSQKQKLRVVSDPVDGNSNHCIVNAWPPEKSAQKSIAQEIVQAAVGIRFSGA